MPRGLIGWIGPGVNSKGCEVPLQLAPAEGEQWSDEHSIPRCHTGQAGGAGPVEDPHENRLGLVVGVVPGEDRPGPRLMGDFAEPAIPGDPGLRFGGIEAESDLFALEAKAERSGVGPDPVSNDAAVRVDPVVEMRHDRQDGVPAGGGDQQVQEGE